VTHNGRGAEAASASRLLTCENVARPKGFEPPTF
jgi:hypothetical protein